ncbi:MAG: DUF523 and DUF1722 domain-containing protein [Gammaproteobacteria bacterium]|nr:DUF523 and DUF1722 domain-containing protein [Gammaproteobacteria bacterium]
MGQIRIGVSACLLGQPVRYDGEHKVYSWLSETLAVHVELLGICPEVAIGLGVPRPPIQLVMAADTVRVRGVDAPHTDFTQALREYGVTVALQTAAYSGFVFKKGSPSCGIQGVKRFRSTNEFEEDGVGMFAQQIMQQNPDLPVEDEAGLDDPYRRDNFLTRIFVMKRWQDIQQQGITPGALLMFHQHHKFLYQAHHEGGYRTLGRMVAEMSDQDINIVAQDYFKTMMQVLRQHVTRDSHVNVLTHIYGFFKTRVNDVEKRRVLQAIEKYHAGKLPLNVPIESIKQCLQQYPDEYIAGQWYLEPYPTQLKLAEIL